MDWKPGDLATWHGTYPGGYGYRFVTPVRVLRVGPKRVLVEATVVRPTERAVTRWIDPENLTRRDVQ